MARDRLALILALTVTVAAHAAGPWIVEGRVVAISDGDTVTLLDDNKTQHKIRFAGIDAPEKGQAFGNTARESLSRLVFNKRVEARCHKRDRYGREVCAVFVGSRDVGLEQVHAGMAWWFRGYAHEQSAADQGAEDEARISRHGLWQDKKPVARWDWREGRAALKGARYLSFRTPWVVFRDQRAESRFHFRHYRLHRSASAACFFI